MNVLDLFSGIGGFSLGLEAAGMRTVAFCEIEKYPQKILRQHWPNVPVFDDVRTLAAQQLPEPVDLICGGYPCQPFSVAGKQRGVEDERHLWPEVFRLVQSIRPRWVFCENVAGHIRIGFDEVATSLEVEGYIVWPFVIPACSVNAPHRRDRVWIIGHAKHNGLPAATQPREFGTADDNITQGQKELSQSTRPIGLWSELVADTARNKSCEGWGRVWNNADAGIVADTVNIGCEGSECEAVQWKRAFAREPAGSFTQWANGWPVSSPRICGIHDGVSNRTQRLKALGNAIVPQIAYLIGKTIMQYDREFVT